MSRNELPFVGLPGVSGPSELPPVTRGELWWWGIAGAVATIGAMCAFEPWRVGIVTVDPRDFFFMAERFAHGVPPHVSAFFPQNALSLMVSGAGIGLGEAVGIGALSGSRLASGLAFAITVGAIGALALRLTGRRLVAILAMGIMLSFSLQVLVAAAGSQTKTILVMFLTTSLLAAAGGRFVLAGALGTCATLTYQPAVVLPVALAVVVLTRPDRWSLLGRVIGVSAALVLAFESYFLATGALDAQVRQAVLFPGAVRSELIPGISFGVLLESWRVGAGELNPAPILFFACLGALAVQAIRRPAAMLRELLARPGWSYLLLTLAPVLLYSLTDHQGASDLLFVLPYVAVVAAAAIGELVAILPTRRSVVSATAAILVAGVALGLHDYRRMRWIGFDSPLDDQLDMAAEVGEWLDRGESVFTLGSLYLLGLNHTDNWSPYSISFAVRPDEGYWDYRRGPVTFDISRDGALPDVIVWARGQPRGWPEWLERRYVEITPPLFAEHGSSVWQRRGAIEIAAAGDPPQID